MEKTINPDSLKNALRELSNLKDLLSDSCEKADMPRLEERSEEDDTHYIITASFSGYANKQELSKLLADNCNGKFTYDIDYDDEEESYDYEGYDEDDEDHIEALKVWVSFEL